MCACEFLLFERTGRYFLFFEKPLGLSSVFMIPAISPGIWGFLLNDSDWHLAEPDFRVCSRDNGRFHHRWIMPPSLMAATGERLWLRSQPQCLPHLKNDCLGGVRSKGRLSQFSVAGFVRSYQVRGKVWTMTKMNSTATCTVPTAICTAPTATHFPVRRRGSFSLLWW